MILDFFRKKEGLFTKFILILLAITFIFGLGFGLVNFGTGGNVPQGTAAEVNGEKIPVMDFYRVRDNLYRQYRQQGEIPKEAMSFVDQLALEQLIDLKLLSQKARDLGFRVTDEELSESIKSIPALQIDGEFVGFDAYKSFIEEGFNESVGEFEKKYREELLAQKFVNFINETAKVSDEELFNLYRMENERANLYFVRFSPDDFMESFTPTEEDIKKYYEAHKNEFKTPELRSISYVTVKPEHFENKVSVSEDEIKAYYEAHADDFKDEGGVRPLSDVKDVIRENIKREQVIHMREEFTQNLEELLKKNSLSEIAVKNGLDKVRESGTFSATQQSDQIPQPVKEMAFSTGKGQKSYSQVGNDIWIIEVKNVASPQQKTLQQAEGEIRERLKFMKAKETAKLKAEEALKKARTDAGGLEKVAAELGLKLEETGFFSRLQGAPGIDSDDLLIDAFFLDDKNPVAPKVYDSWNGFYVVSLKEKQKVEREGFLATKAELREGELSKRRRTLYLDWVQKLRQDSEIDINQNLFLPQG
ncbi:MAG TPA: SurA N-terminal domain-containing protein [Thermodesulfobacteriota bacterium]|nr:SurA N-terminal domain-containing protein [Thermodesulfobacteriota bacterium]